MLSTFHFSAIKVGCESERLPPEMNHKTANFRSFFCCLHRTRVRHVKLRNIAAEVTQPSRKLVLLLCAFPATYNKVSRIMSPERRRPTLRNGERQREFHKIRTC